MTREDTGKNLGKLTVTVQEAAVILGIGRATAYEGVRTGAIPSLRVMKRILIPLAALERLLDGQQVRR